MPYELNFLVALGATVSIELAVIAIIAKLFLKKVNTFSNVAVISAGLLPTMTTLPYIWFVFPYFIVDRQIYVISSESFAVIVESFILFVLLKRPLQHCFLISLLANMISVLLGLVIL